MHDVAGVCVVRASMATLLAKIRAGREDGRSQVSAVCQTARQMVASPRPAHAG